MRMAKNRATPVDQVSQIQRNRTQAQKLVKQTIQIKRIFMEAKQILTGKLYSVTVLFWSLKNFV